MVRWGCGSTFTIPHRPSDCWDRPLDATGLPQHIVLYRGFKDVWGRARPDLVLVAASGSGWGQMLRLETSAVDANAVNPAVVDAFKVEPVLLAELRLGPPTCGSGAVTALPSCRASP